MKTDRILIATDGTDASNKVVRFGFNLAVDLDAQVLLVGVIRSSSAMGNPDAGIFPDDALIGAETKMTAHLLQKKMEYGAKVETLLLSKDGEVQQGIVDAAKRWNAGLVIIGTHSHTGIKSLFHSSLAEAVIHHSPVPVCVIPL